MTISAVQLDGAPAMLVTGDDLSSPENIAELAAIFRRAGAVLLRGFALDREGFEAFTRAAGGTFLVHHSRHRSPLSADRTTQTVTKGRDAVELHRERSYMPHAPDTLFFFCETPSSEGGETTLADGVAVFEGLSEETKRFARASRVAWTQRTAASRWRSAFAGVEKEMVVSQLEAERSTLPGGEDLRVSFAGNDDLLVRYLAPLVARPRPDGREAIATYVLLALSPGQEKQIQPELESGAAFPRAIAAELAESAWRCEGAVRWNAGDVLMIDNSRFMHGRRPFADERRKIVVRMCHSR